MTKKNINAEYLSLIIAHPVNQTPKYRTLKKRARKKGAKKKIEHNVYKFCALIYS